MQSVNAGVSTLTFNATEYPVDLARYSWLGSAQVRDHILQSHIRCTVSCSSRLQAAIQYNLSSGRLARGGVDDYWLPPDNRPLTYISTSGPDAAFTVPASFPIGAALIVRHQACGCMAGLAFFASQYCTGTLAAPRAGVFIQLCVYRHVQQRCRPERDALQHAGHGRVHEQRVGCACSIASPRLTQGALSLQHLACAAAGVDLDGFSIIKALGRPMSITAGQATVVRLCSASALHYPFWHPCLGADGVHFSNSLGGSVLVRHRCAICSCPASASPAPFPCFV